MTNTIQRLKADVIETIQHHLDNMQDEIIEDSPVLTGYFKSQWQEDKDYSRLKFRLWNETVYGLRLWRYHHSQKGWSPITGDAVVAKHFQKLNNALSRLNNRIYKV